MADKKDEREESSLVHLSNSWGKIAAAFVATASIATFLSNVFSWEYHVTLAACGFAGVILLFMGLMLDRSAKRQIKHDKEQDAELSRVESALEEIKDSLITIRKDSVRIQLNQMLWHDRDNKEAILKLAHTYFVVLRSDWYMTSMFLEWAKEKGVEVPPQIQHCINDSHKEN